MNAHSARRDPAASCRLATALAAIALLWPWFEAAQFKPTALFDARNLRLLGRFLSGFLPPESGPEFLTLLGRAALETLAIASAGIALAWLIAVPLALCACQALSRSSLGPGPGRRRSRMARAVVRAVLVLLRGIPELVWALVFVRIFGLGPAAGVLALGLTYGGMLAKVYAEILESGDVRPARALLAAGSGRIAACAYGLLPGAVRELASYTVYRWECALRASVVMGFVGAGGLGQLMDQAMKMLNGGEAASILLTFLALVLAADMLSAWLRARLDQPAAARRAAVGFKGWALLAFAGLAIAASFAFLDLGFGALLTREALTQFVEFCGGFFPPDTDGAWLARVGKGAWETLAISAVGTLLAALAGLLFALPAAGRYGRLPSAASRFALNALRSVPELVWATIAVLAAGLGPFAGVLALALHTGGVLGRLFAESLENAPSQPARALRLAGCGPVAAFCYGLWPVVLPQLLAYTLYRWEINIRMAAILGFVGAGGLGQLLYVELSLFHQPRAATVIAAMLLLCTAVDAASARIRRKI